MSIGLIEEIQYYFSENYKEKFERFDLFNISHEYYRGYATEVYTSHNHRVTRSLLAPVIHVFREPPANMRWFGV